MDGPNSIGLRVVVREFSAVRNADDLLAKAFERIAADSMSSSPQARVPQPNVYASIEPQLSETCT